MPVEEVNRLDESILLTIKKLIGIEDELDAFDIDVMVFTNSTFSILTQLGVGPPDGFVIVDGTESWSDYTMDPVLLGFVKIYIATKVKLTFDPPSSSALLKAMEDTIKELTWRMIVHVESSPKSDPPAI